MRGFLDVFAVVTAVSLLASGHLAWSQESAELAKQTIHRHAVDAVLCGVPTVSFASMRQAYCRDAKANYNDIIWWPRESVPLLRARISPLREEVEATRHRASAVLAA